jgi:site-specific DNA-methyltransferase (adenine-specific)
MLGPWIRSTARVNKNNGCVMANIPCYDSKNQQVLDEQLFLPKLSSKPVAIYTSSFDTYFTEYQNNKTITPLLFNGDSSTILKKLPDNSIDFAMTSPPYWNKREYNNGGIGLESHYETFINKLLLIFFELKRVLKDTGSFWLNLGDTYNSKGLLGVPWRIALRLIDEQGWILRNDVIWNKIKGGMDNSKDRLGNVHEYVFHFVKRQKDYYYNVDAIRSRPRDARIINGAVVSATGVSGVRYRRQIELSTALSANEKKAAVSALEGMLSQIARGNISDFRMIIRGQQRTTHSNSEKLSGRAKELKEKGFYFLKYHPNGSKPCDVWDILPEDTQHRELHFAPYPMDLCYIPLLATCPKGGIVLDPFCGTGTTLIAARNLGDKSLGIDISCSYLTLAQKRIEENNEFHS